MKPPELPSWTNEPADLRGPFGRAWHSRYEISPGDPDPSAKATIDMGWLIFCPGAHILWSWWALVVVSVTDIEGFPPAHKQYPQAEYELICGALDPDAELPNPYSPIEVPKYRFMHPLDHVLQFHDVPGGDVGARELAMLFASACCKGMLSPDQDFRAAWQESLRLSLEHLRYGGHP
ncbi:MAG: hypothetical protein QOJ29_5022 [Thermoleophilaceae bacterium]|jgi:hypothetical protein|nr:hypothetical protein [Thermoleophilaceae bacterium]